MQTILVSGGTGFIGSHTCVELIKAGYDVVVFDNLSNSKEESLNRVQRITGVKPRFYRADMLDRDALESIFEAEPDISAVIHFAGLKAVGESVQKPWEYYQNNIEGTLVLVDVMRRHGVKSIVFSSSATVYGDPAFVPITEECPLGNPTNPYGQTKKMLEQILTDLNVADPEWNVSLLRYFNPIGAHESGLMGEDPNGIPNNLMPYITQVALGKLPRLGVFGDDYDTPDGTGVRDYIHVVDLARGHVKTLQATDGKPGVHIWNLGTGVGYSVLDVVRAFTEATGVEVPYEIKPRRAGDIAQCYASAGKAARDLGWKAEFDLRDMCRDSWRWQKGNPNGYDN
ncbi:UDP-glucose 4-epimerase GalE [Curtanaerobium respiraculi]|uniref:UDP-glucose 4-epimerase GalE n=1 Tax=Curtanaerobium respiraculi TaxID=2949669 RepID=UPI0024B3B310|nr:UDP-glucose 4-epimerase GalE [Curtanaerobium respiraculi]